MSIPQSPTAMAQEAREYVVSGLALVPIPLGQKGPRTPGWNRYENAWTRPEQVPVHYFGNIGLLHEFSGTCVIDIDDLVLALAFFKARGVNLLKYLEAPDAVMIVSGRQNRAKLLYRLSPSTGVLPTLKHKSGEIVIFELRCAGVQDVLPPSTHPDTGNAYTWKGDRCRLPFLPEELSAIWSELRVPQSKHLLTLGPVPDYLKARSCIVNLGLSPIETPEAVDRLRSALDAIPPCGSHDDWIIILFAVKAHAFTVGKELARAWSRRCQEKYNDNDFDTAWNSDRGHGIGAGTLYFLAKQNGWSPDTEESPQTEAPASQPATNNTTSRCLVVVDIGNLLTSPFPPREMLLSPWLQSQSLVMVYAWRGVGKTHIALCIAYALASGGTFLGWTASVPVRVLYIDGEMPGPALQERVARIVASNERAVQPSFLNFITPDLQPNGVMPNLATFEGQALVESVLCDAKVIIVDNLSCLARGGKENEAESWQPVADWALRMRAQGRSVIFIHHSGKGGAQRGTSKREDLLDAVLLLNRPGDYEPAQGARFEIHFENARALFGQDVTPVEAKLETTPDGKQRWTTKTVEAIADAQMIELAQLGLSQAEIARELGCHRSTVLRALAKAQAEGRYQPKSAPLRSAKPVLRAGGAKPSK